MGTNIRATPYDLCGGQGGWAELTDFYPNEHARLLGLHTPNLDPDRWRASIAFSIYGVKDAQGKHIPVNLFHMTTDPGSRAQWKAGLEIGLRQDRLSIGFNHGIMPQETISRYEEVAMGPNLGDGRRHVVNVWKTGEWLGLQIEDDGPITSWRLPPHQWTRVIAKHLSNTLYVGGRADHGDFKFYGHIESLLFQTGICEPLNDFEGPLPCCRMTVQTDPGKIIFALFREGNQGNELALVVVRVNANPLITVALHRMGPLFAPPSLEGLRVGIIGEAQSQTFEHLRAFIIARFPILFGPLIVEAVGNGTTLNDELLPIRPELPLGKGTILEYVARQLSVDGMTVAQTTTDPDAPHSGPKAAPMLRLAMKILRPMCEYLPQ
jgi:hypothetical protein